jgi:hypothetical protein
MITLSHEWRFNDMKMQIIALIITKNMTNMKKKWYQIGTEGQTQVLMV